MSGAIKFLLKSLILVFNLKQILNWAICHPGPIYLLDELEAISSGLIATGRATMGLVILFLVSQV